MMKVLTVGGATLDSIAIIDDARIERMTMRNADSSFLLVEEGRKTEAETISNHCGGGAVNTGVAMARLGADVSTLVKLGRDQRADTILQRLTDEGISTRWVLRDERAATGASLLISSHAKDAAIFTFRGANTLLCDTDLHDDMFAVDLVYVSSLSNQSAACFPQLVARAKNSGAMVATNPGIRQLTSRGRDFRETLGGIDLLSINRTEATALVPMLADVYGEGGPDVARGPDDGPDSLVTTGFSSGGYHMSLAGLMNALGAEGVGRVVITAGGSGAYLKDGTTLLHCPVMASEVAGTAGAGDAFAATLACLLAQGRASDEALRAATANAGSVVSHPDTQTGLLHRDDLEKRLATVGAEVVRSWDL